MKRDLISGFSKGGTPPGHRFPAMTLMCSVGLLIGGMRLADVLPLPHLPRFFAHPVPDTTVAPRPYGAALGGELATIAGAPGGSAPLIVPGAVRTALPTERITREDVTFEPVHVPLWSMASRLTVRADKANLTLVDPRTETTFWSGTTADSHFLYSNIAGAQVLKDEKGVVIWSDVPVPDLLFEKNADGKARLSDRNGKTLWDGHLSATTPGGSARGDHRGTTYTLDFGGVRVNGINGYFTVIDGTGDSTRILWSGSLPVQPILLFREDHKFLFWGVDRSDSGSDRTTDIRISQETGMVSLTDARDQPLGEQPVNLIKVESSVHVLEGARTIRVPMQYCVPYGNLGKSGSVLFTYRDSAGIVVRKNSVVRDGDVQRINNNGLPY